MSEYYVMHNGVAVFVKEAEFFKSQGGLTQPWGQWWRGPIQAESIEHARDKGIESFSRLPPRLERELLSSNPIAQSHVDFMTRLHEANASRGQRWHPSGLVSWSLSDWFTAMAGEVGELGNVVKKLNRARDGLKGNKESEPELREMLAKEAADILIYLELFAQVAGFDLVEATRRKFNEVSERHGFPERL